MATQRWLVLGVVAVGFLATPAAQERKLTFEVASVKKRDSVDPAVTRRTDPGSPIFYVRNARVVALISFAYNISGTQVVGGPAWIRNDVFEINARSAGESSDEEQRRMVQSLLEERFNLIVRQEQRQMRFGALVVARDGRVGPALTQCDGTSAPSLEPILVPRGGMVSVLHCVPMTVLADVAARVLDLPVVDKTGLTGRWNHVLTYAAPRPVPPGLGGERIDPNLSSFPTALEEQLGLKVETTTGLMDVLVVESVQQPTED